MISAYFLLTTGLLNAGMAVEKGQRPQLFAGVFIALIGAGDIWWWS